MSVADAPPTDPGNEWIALHSLASSAFEELATWVETNARTEEVSRRSALRQAVEIGTRALAMIGVLGGLAKQDGGPSPRQLRLAHARVYQLREAATSLLGRFPKEAPL